MVTFALAIAVVSSVITALVIGLGLRWWMERRVATAGDEIADKVRTAVEEGAESAIRRLSEAVRSGVGESVEGALPQVQDAVRSGVEEAIASTLTGGMVEKAGGELARKGASVLNRILGGPEER